MSRVPICRPSLWLWEHLDSQCLRRPVCCPFPTAVATRTLAQVGWTGPTHCPVWKQAQLLLFTMHPVDENNYPSANMILITYILSLSGRSELRPSENTSLSPHFIDRWIASRESLGLRFQLVPSKMEEIFCCCLENRLHICCLISGTMLNSEPWEKGRKHRRMILQDHQAHGIQMR